MTEGMTASTQITEAVTAWPGVDAGPGARGASVAFRLGARELGHLHGDRSFHTGFPPDVWNALKEQGRIEEHPVFPGKTGPAARRIETDDDIRDVIALLRINYDRAMAQRAEAAAG